MRKGNAEGSLDKRVRSIYLRAYTRATWLTGTSVDRARAKVRDTAIPRARSMA